MGKRTMLTEDIIDKIFNMIKSGSEKKLIKKLEKSDPSVALATKKLKQNYDELMKLLDEM